MSADGWLADTRTSYDTIADGYADLVRDALAGHRFLRAALVSFTEGVCATGGGPVADVGCGPGHVTAHLRGLGLDAFGVDLSPRMIDVARRDHPGFEIEARTLLGPDGTAPAAILSARRAA